MNAPICPVHNLEAKWKEGKGQYGHYAFWSCPVRKEMNNGQYCQHKFPKPQGRQGAQEAFGQSMAADAQKNQQSEKDRTITRLAIAKSLIERGEKYGRESLSEFFKWVNLVEGKVTSLEQGLEAAMTKKFDDEGMYSSKDAQI